MNPVRSETERLNEKTLDQMFVNMVEYGYECPPFISNAILETAKTVFVPDQSNPNTINVGQMKILGVSKSELAGKPLSKCTMKTAVVTLDAGSEDEEIRSKYGLAALRQARLSRIANEALDQGVLLTQEDLAYKLLNCGVRTVRRDIKALDQRGIVVPTRGQQKDIGPGISHRTKIVRLYICRKTYTDIERTMKHSQTAIKRYVQTFGRVAHLTRIGTSANDIAFLVHISDRLVREYQELYHQYNEDPAYQERIVEIVESAEFYQADKRGAIQ
jgi:hypothetical protein